MDTSVEEVFSEVVQVSELTNADIQVDDVNEEAKVLEEEATEVIEDATEIQEPIYFPEYNCESPWTLICETRKEFETSKAKGFLKGCKWSPDGTCLLTCADDGLLRLFDLPADLYKSHKTTFQGCSTAELTPSLRIKEGEIIYDYCWHPHMSSWNAETCLCVIKAKNFPS